MTQVTIYGFNITDPSIAPIVNDGTIMGLPGEMAAGLYMYKYTYVTAFGESAPSPVSTVNSLGSVVVSIPNVTTLDNTNVVSRNLYRTRVNNTLPYGLVANLPDFILVTYVDRSPDSALGGTPPTSSTASSREQILGDVSFTNTINYANGIITAAGNSLSTATAIVSSVISVNTPSAGLGVRLPSGSSGQYITVTNLSTNLLNIYPAIDTQIDALSAGSPYAINATTVSFIRYSATQWYSIPLASSGFTDATNTYLGAFVGNPSSTGARNTLLSGLSFRNLTSGSDNVGLGPYMNADGASSNNICTGIEFDNTTVIAPCVMNNSIKLTRRNRTDAERIGTMSNSIMVGFNTIELINNINDSIILGSGIIGVGTISHVIRAGGSNGLTNNSGVYNTLHNGSMTTTNTGASYNTTSGSTCLNVIQNGLYNVVIGNLNAVTLQNGSGNTIIGGSIIQTATTYSNMTAIGSGIINPGTESTYMATGMGCSAIGNTSIGGQMYTNTTLPTNGDFSTHVGHRAHFDITANCSQNTSAGYNIMMNLAGSFNCVLGGNSLISTVGSNDASAFNTIVGINSATTVLGAMRNTFLATVTSLTTGSDNVSMATGALNAVTAGSRNTASGTNAGSACNGNDNTFLGETLSSYTLGSNNIHITAGGGTSTITSTSGNIMIQSPGVVGDTNTMRIGTGSQVKTFISGIRSVVPDNTNVPLLIDSVGQLGTTSSSEDTKENIRVLDDDIISKFDKLDPVKYYLNYYKGNTIQHYGLIAEKLIKLYPNMVICENGVPETIRYKDVLALCCAVLQKHKKVIDAKCK